MADNTQLNSGTGGDIIATDDIAGIKHQRVKVQFGADGAATDVAAAAPLPIEISDGVDTASVSAAGALLVDGSAVTQPVSGTVTANAGTGTFTVDGSSVTQPISAASLPLPTGAATAAAQLPDGHNVTVDNAAGSNSVPAQGDAAENAPASGNPVLVGGRYDATPRTLGDLDVGAIALDPDGAVHISDGGNTITVDGTVTATPTGTQNVDVTANTVGLATAANQLPDGHNVTVDNAAGASAVNIQDGGNKITVDWNGTDPPIGAGTEAAALRVTMATDSTGQMTVDGTVNAAQSGTWNVNNVSGTVSLPTGAATAAAQLADGHSVVLNTGLANVLSDRVADTAGASAAFTNLGATASNRNYITAISIYNSSATDAYVDFRDGTAGSVFWTQAAPANGGSTICFPFPLRQATTNTALAYDPSAAISTLYISVQGFQSTL